MTIPIIRERIFCVLVLSVQVAAVEINLLVGKPFNYFIAGACACLTIETIAKIVRMERDLRGFSWPR